MGPDVGIGAGVTAGMDAAAGISAEGATTGASSANAGGAIVTIQAEKQATEKKADRAFIAFKVSWPRAGVFQRGC